jgi:DNA (cytosine-5)-methyltransferase 1
MKILNLYAGIGGNRKLWGEEHEITAVEMDENIATVYKDLFPNDNIVIGDAHQYLMDHYKEFDFIWTSPPCQTHSSFRQNIGVRYRGVQAVYPDMKLYQEIIFLQHNFNGQYVVENVRPYYSPLIKPDVELDRHLFWTNIDVPKAEFDRPKIRSAQIPQLQEFLGYDLSDYKLPNKRQVLRNCVQPLVGKYILDAGGEERE